MNICLLCGSVIENSEAVRFNYSHQTSLAEHMSELIAQDDCLHVSKTAMIMMCIFGIIGLLLFLCETILGVIEIIEH